MRKDVLERIDSYRQTVIDLQRELVGIPALGPINGGDGEKAKAEFLMDYLRAMGLPDVRQINAPDERVPCGYRPSVVAVLPGEDSSKTLWVISHTDIVPPGDLSLWESDPYVLQVDGDYVVGRGVEDNHMAVVCSVLAAKAFLETGAKPRFNLGLLMVADEETGSKYGLDYIVRHHAGLFGPDDLFLVPDFGVFDGTQVEVAEKSIMWAKITVLGKQCHASSPEEGVNSLLASAAFIMKLRGLYQTFDKRNDLFKPPFSTFEPTKKEANVENVNTIPGKDVFYLDCRVLADYDLDDVFDAIRAIGEEVSREYGVRIEYDFVQKEQAAPQTDPSAEVVTRLMAGIRSVYGVEPQAVGVGGGTVAAYLRRRSRPAVVWASWIPNAHQPGERSSISKTLGDTKVMAHMLLAE